MPRTARQLANDRGARAKTRTRKWLEARGYSVVSMERVHYVWNEVHGRIPTKRDQWGADLAAMNGKVIVFVQVKFGSPVEAASRRAFARHPYPPFVKRWVIAWTLRVRAPRIIDCTPE